MNFLQYLRLELSFVASTLPVAVMMLVILSPSTLSAFKTTGLSESSLVLLGDLKARAKQLADAKTNSNKNWKKN